MKRAVVVGFVCVFSRATQAHDFWIEPSTFRPSPGSVVQVALRVGEDFKGEPVKRDGAKIEKFVILGPEGEKPIMGMEGADPAGLAKVDAAGLHVAAYFGKPRSIELPADKFEEYLREEGLETIVAQRAERGEREKPGREIYSRCAKAMIFADGKTVSADAEAPPTVGMPLELAAEKNPYLAPGKTPFRVRLLFHGQPLAGAKLAMVTKESPAAAEFARTDSDGWAAFKAPLGGTVMITTVHMVRASASVEVDWESYWATLIFEAKPPAADGG
jgi:uncharacterized GH25 family protein